MSNPEVKIRLSLDGAGQVQSGVDQTAEKLLKLEKAAADVATAEARLATATQKAATAQEALAKASNFPNTSAKYLGELQAKASTSAAALQQATVRAKEAQAALTALGESSGAAGQKISLSGHQLAQVSAQLQDFFIQIQGGQAPLIAFAQQGSQLSAVFGGVGNAGRAMLSLLTPAVVGVGTLAAAVVGIGAAYYKGDQEAREFNRTLILTGNAAGVSAAQMMNMAAAVRSMGAGTQGRAAEILNQMAGSALIGAENLQRFTASALLMERAGGPAAEATAKAFADMGRAPLDAAKKLDEATNFLTASTYKQIKALEEQGRTADAARVAQEAYAKAMEDRAPKLMENLGFIEQAWKKVGIEAKDAWDRMLDVGRADTADSLRKKIADVYAKSYNVNTDSVAGRSFAREMADLERRLAIAEQTEGLAGKEAASQAQSVALKRTLVAWDVEAAKYASDRVRMEKELEATRTRGQALVEAGLLSEKAYRTQLLAIREKFAEKKDDSNPFVGEQAVAQEWAKAYEDFARAASDANAQLLGLSKTEMRIREIRAQDAPAGLGAMKDMLVAQGENAVAAEKSAKAYKEVNDAYDKYVEGLTRNAAQAGDRLQRLDDEEQAAAMAAKGFFSLAQSIELVTIARLEEQMAADKKAGNQEAVDALQKEIDKRKALVQVIGKQESRKLEDDALKALDAYLDPSKAQSFGEALSQAFGNAGNSLAKLSSALGEYGRQQAEIASLQAKAADITDPEKRIEAQRKLAQVSIRGQEQTISLYANMAGAAKGFFAEGTKGYKAMQIAETAFTAYQLASDLAKGTSAAAVGVANQAKGDPYSAWARMAAMAATMAALGYQVSNFSSGGAPSGGDGAKQATGTGTVLGDAQAKSESIVSSIDLLSDTAKMQLSTQSGMLAALKSIEANIGGLSGLVLRSSSASGGAAAKFGVSEGFDRLAGGLGQYLFGPVWTKITGTKTTITGNGLFAGPQSLGSILSGGLNLQDYADVNSKSKFFGITYSNKNSTQYQASDPVLQQQFGLVFKSFNDALKLAAVPLGVSLDDIAARVNSFTVDIGKIDLAGLTGDQIQEKLSAVLGAAGDSLASAVLPGLNDFQKIGEGYLETVIRVASGVETATASLDLLGIQSIKLSDVLQKQGDVGAEIVRQSIVAYESLDGSLSGVGKIIDSLAGSAEDLASAYTALDDARDVLIAVGKSGDTLTASMLRGAGGLENLQSSLETYFDAFYSDKEKADAKRAQLTTDFAKIGINAVPASREAFKALVSGIDTTTEAGQKFFAQVIGLAGAFDEALKATEKLAGGVANLQDVLGGQAKTRSGLQVDLLTAQGDTAGAAALKRRLDLADLTKGMNAEDAAAAAASYDLTEALRIQIKTTLDAAATAKAEAQRVLSERESLETQLLQAQGDTAALRERELAALAPANRELKLMIYALEDQAKITAKAAEAAQKVSDALATLGDTRFDLENELLSMGGNDADVQRRIRERDLARITAGMSAEDAAKVTADYDFVEGLKKQVAATKAATEAAETIARAQEQAAETAARAAEQIKEAWQSATATLFDEAAKIRGLTTADSPASLAAAQANFAIATGQARAGDQDAVKKLPELARLVVEIGKNQAGSQLELDRLRAAVAASLESTGLQLASTYGLSVPKLATGTNYVPRDMLAFLHEGEQVTPKAFNPAAGGGTASDELVREVKALREQVARLEATGGRTANATERARDILTNVTENGKAMQVETAS